jgi:LPXTG-site transpeptidase (sortase) family protein
VDRRSWTALALAVGVTITGCNGGSRPGPSAAAAPTPAAVSGTTRPTGTTESVAPVPPARSGTPAASQRVRFVPAVVVLPGGATAPIQPASTVDGLLVVPEQVQRVGWWDGGAQAGDPFGSVVLAGHVDSATEGLGFFVRLLKVRTGDEIAVRAVGHHATYRVSRVESVPRNALATGSDAFDQAAPHRLVLITCTGAYDRSRGGYQRNLVVTALPVGPAT